MAVLRLNRPEALNALNEPLLRALLGSVDAARRDPAVRCLLVLGAGRAFCAGGDLKAMLAMKDKEEFRAYIQLFQQLSGDSGAGATLGSFKSRIAGIGPQIGYFFPVGKEKGYVNLRGYWEFGAQNRAEGWNLWLSLALPLSMGN